MSSLFDLVKQISVVSNTYCIVFLF